MPFSQRTLLLCATLAVLGIPARAELPRASAPIPVPPKLGTESRKADDIAIEQANRGLPRRAQKQQPQPEPEDNEILLEQAGQEQAPLRKVHVLLVADTDSQTVGDSLAIDLKRMQTLLTKNLPADRLSLTTLQGKEKSTWKSVQAACVGLRLKQDEGIVLYFGGNGCATRDGKRYLVFSDAARTPRSEVLDTLKKTGAGMVLLLTDSCEDFRQEPAVKSKPDPLLETPLARLLLKERGVIDVGAVAPGQTTYCDDENGGIFTRALARVLADAKTAGPGESVTWERVLPLLRAESSRNLEALKQRDPVMVPASVRATPSLNRGGVAVAQQPENVEKSKNRYAVVTLRNASPRGITAKTRWPGEGWTRQEIPAGREVKLARHLGTEAESTLEARFPGVAETQKLAAAILSGTPGNLPGPGNVHTFQDGKVTCTESMLEQDAEEKMSISERAPARKGTMRALCVGVNDYQGVNKAVSKKNWTFDDLRCPVPDATAVAAFLGSQAEKGLFRSVAVTTLTDKEVTAARILEAIAAAGRELGKDDCFVLYLSGHSHTDRQGKGKGGVTTSYYLCADSDCDLPKTLLSGQALGEALQKIKARKLILLEADGSLAETVHRLDPQALILSSCGSNQQSLEPSEEKDGSHSLFTRAFLEAAGAVPDRGKVRKSGEVLTAAGLGQSIKARLPDLLRALEQKPDVQVPSFYPKDLSDEPLFVTPGSAEPVSRRGRSR